MLFPSPWGKISIQELWKAAIFNAHFTCCSSTPEPLQYFSRNEISLTGHPALQLVYWLFSVILLSISMSHPIIRTKRRVLHQIYVREVVQWTGSHKQVCQSLSKSGRSFHLPCKPRATPLLRKSSLPFIYQLYIYRFQYWFWAVW